MWPPLGAISVGKSVVAMVMYIKCIILYIINIHSNDISMDAVKK